MRCWLWIIPINSEELEDLWDFCLQEGVAAMQYEIGVDARAEHNRALAEQIEVGDKVVAYLNRNRIGGVGTVIERFYDEATPYKPSADYPWGQRIGVEWLPPEGGPIDIRMLPNARQSRDALVLMSQTIHLFDLTAFDEIAAAIQITRENPLPKIADLLESVSLTDVACREAQP
jgi:hypothetical protein